MRGVNLLNLFHVCFNKYQRLSAKIRKMPIFAVAYDEEVILYTCSFVAALVVM